MLPPWGHRGGFSSYELLPYWIYSVGEDFHSPTGENAAYDPSHPQSWDADEVLKITYSEKISSISLNADGTLLALGVGGVVRIHDLKEQREIHVLENYGDGNDMDVTEVVWSPVEPTVLVVFTQPSRPRDRKLPRIAPTITFHDLKDLDRFSRICGQLICSFGSRPFSHDGNYVLYLPDDEMRRSHGDSLWNIHIANVTHQGVRCTLTGHTDSIHWAGFNHDDTFVGSASSDGTFTIWDAMTGTAHQVLKPPTHDQMWAAGFSPDGELFAGTAGCGPVYVWNVHTGDMVSSFEFGTGTEKWSRTLDWSPDGQHLALGGVPMGMVLVVDPHAVDAESRAPHVIQKRLLSAEKCDSKRKDT